jgi:hypothetical protein
MGLKVSDNAATTLAASITSSPGVTGITLANASKFPVINHGGTGSDWSYATLFDGANNLEVVKVTRRDNASNNLTIVRGTAMGLANYSDADCKAWASGTTGVACRLIAGVINDIDAAAVAAAASAAAAAASAAAAVAGVKVTDNDTTSGKLNAKMAVTGALTKTVTNPGGAEVLTLGVNVPVTSVFGRTGAVVLTSGDVTGALGYTPYNFGGTVPWHNGNLNPGAYLSLGGGTLSGSLFMPGGMRLYGDGSPNIGFLTTGGGWAFRTDNGGNIIATANVIAYSDETLKAEWRELPRDFLARLAQVKMGVYARTDTDLAQVGVGAQSLREVMPEAVIEGPDGLLGVAYGNAALAACVALAREVVALRAEIEDLKRSR